LVGPGKKVAIFYRYTGATVRPAMTPARSGTPVGGRVAAVREPQR